MTEVKKNPTPELTDEQLTAVSGGVQKIKDTHYYFHKGDTLVMGTEKFVIEKDYLDVDPEIKTTSLIRFDFHTF